MGSAPEFLLIALVVTVTPGPGTAMIIRVAARDGRRTALSAVIGNSGGVLIWGVLSAVGVSSLIVASQLAYDALRIAGAVILVALGLRSLLRRGETAEPAAIRSSRFRAWRVGLATSLANPKLAVFFIALFPQFLSRDAPVLPLALAMAATIVMLDLAWYSLLAYAVDRASAMLRPRLQRLLERVTGAVMVGLGIRMAIETR